MNTLHIIFCRNFHFKLCFLVFTLLFVACKKDPSPEPVMETGTIHDMEGNTYKTIKIGNQWWMAEDLRATKYRDGTSIKSILPEMDVEWKSDTVGAYTEGLYSEGNYLYNWYAVNNIKNIAPEGWHVPTDEDWKELERALGMNTEEANKTGWRGSEEAEKLMKENESSATYWIPFGDVWATNESGFSALPGGCRFFDGTKGDGDAKQTGFWWSSTLQGDQVWYRYLDYKNKNIFRYHGPKAYGFSIRCVLN